MQVSDKKIVFNTVFEKLSVTIIDGRKLEYHSEYYEKKRNAFNIDKMIEGALAACGVEFSDISKIYVFCGPGSFTGIKLGLSMVYGLLCGSGERCVPNGLSLLDYLLFCGLQKKCDRKRLTAVIPGVRGEYFAKTMEPVKDDMAASFKNISDEFVVLSEKMALDTADDRYVADPLSKAFFTDEKLPSSIREGALTVKVEAEGILKFIDFCEETDNSRFLPLSPIYLKDTYAIKPKTETC
ncbi:MAG TPA: hypothetical protein PKK26_04760 [Candidatus Wallbacteria bacterium]|nr:hypothetical protein [Candidatus Wallbacteria bacterium]